MEELALVTAITTTTAPTCYSQRIENNERVGILTSAYFECKWYKCENRDDIPINGNVPYKMWNLSSQWRYFV